MSVDLADIITDSLDLDQASQKALLSQVSGYFLSNVIRNFAADSPNNEIYDIQPLQTMMGLRELHISNNHINDISSIALLKDLSILNMRGNEIDDISAIETLNLGWLNLSNNPLSEYSPLLQQKNLMCLSLSFTDICDISALGELSRLKYLALAGLSLTDEQLEALQEKLPNCQITRDVDDEWKKGVFPFGPM